MIEFVSDFFFRDWKARYILYGLVFICGSFYSIFNLLVLGRAEARVSYETVGLTFLLILLVPVTLFLKESKRKPLSLKILKSSRDAERRLKSLGLGLHVEGFATNELKEKSGKLISVDEASRRLGVAPVWLERLAESGKVMAFKIGGEGELYLLEREIDDYFIKMKKGDVRFLVEIRPPRDKAG